MPTNKKKTILFMHQSSDLYGSDRVLLNLIAGLNKEIFTPIVVLPHPGLLSGELEKFNIKVIFTYVLNIHRRMFFAKNLINLPIKTLASLKSLNKILENENIDIVHTNTAVVLLGPIFAWKNHHKHVWHIHEVLPARKWTSKVIAFIVNKLSDHVIFNSEATKLSFVLNNKFIEKKSMVIYNGLSRTASIHSKTDTNILKNQLKINSSHIILGLVGRINSNKGHELLLESFKNLLTEYNQLTLLFIGSTILGMEHLAKELKDKVKTAQLDDKVKIVDFQKDIYAYIDVLDIVVIPSTKPESFGLVAVEAMLSKKPVIASNEGGLAEIVDHLNSGILFKTSDQKELEIAIKYFLEDTDKIVQFGENGYKRALEKFSLNTHVQQFEALYLDIK